MVKTPILCVITTRIDNNLDSHLEIARAAIDGGASMIQLRDKLADTGTLVSIANEIKELIGAKNIKLIVNDNVEAALRSNSDGVHLGFDDEGIREAKKILGNDKIIGASAGNIYEARAAVAGGADYLGVGPVYRTDSKSDAGSPVGVSLLNKIARQSPVPVIAIGGITESNAVEVMENGASGVAVISAVAYAINRKTAVLQLNEIVRHSERNPSLYSRVNCAERRI